MASLETAIKSTKQRFGLIGKSPLFINAMEQALKVAPVDLSVLIIGESGSGKEVFPKIIHENSRRKHEKYMAVNCGAIPAGTINSELFGHEKGSFTGAIADHKGYFEDCNGGTLFLDEVAELPMETQALLLRVLESGEYMRVGSAEVRKTNVRIVAATNKNLDEAIKTGKFREDLFYRLCSVRIDVPPLRRRGDDIWLLIRKFSHDFSDQYKMPEVVYTDEAKQAMLAYRWPGNVRQLKNVAEQIALFGAGNTLSAAEVTKYLPEQQGLVSVNEAEHDYMHEREYLFKMLFKLQQDVIALQSAVQAGHRSETTTSYHLNSEIELLKRESLKIGGTSASGPDEKKKGKIIDINAPAEASRAEFDAPYALEVEQPHIKTLDETERETITRALERNHGKRKKTADELNISERTLYRKIKEYGLESRNQHK
ncbi:MAG: sigma-54 dependent transcriptional regulator [Bacteroidales bacterium]|nr:sigma-54 dependent transcriptional regulator [Bacteroidales bacterium]